MTGTDPRADVLRLWHALELFAPQQVPKLAPAQRVFQGIDDRGLLPWDEGHAATAGVILEEKKTWRHLVFCGLYDVEKVSTQLSNMFQGGDEAYQRRQSGISALATFSVSGDGCVMPGSLTIATCPWAVGALLRASPRELRTGDWLSHFERDRGELEKEFLQLTAGPTEADGSGEPATTVRLTSPLLTRTTELLARRLGVAQALAPGEWRTRTRVVHEKYADLPDDAEFLNSFLLDDLVRVREALPRCAGTALGQYLRAPAPDQVATRLDVRHHVDEVAKRLSPDTVPGGRWPAAPEYSLAASQQFAVATALAELSGRTGIFAVNGPPGTGKTTMLRDMVAAIVVRRAEALADLTHPGHAFSGEPHRYKNEAFERRVYPLREELVGHEIVIASSNNGAVENVTLEIPARQAVQSWPGECSYLTDLAQLVLDGSLEKGKPRVQAWGLMSARLGNSSNRSQFRNSFWFDPRKGRREPDFVPRLYSRLREYENGAAAEPWEDARSAFRTAQARVEKLRSERCRHEQLVQQLQQRRAEYRDATAHLGAVRGELSQTEQEQIAAAARHRGAAAYAGPLRRALAAQELLRPGVWAQLLSWGAEGRRWREQCRPLIDEVAAAERAEAAAQREAHEIGVRRGRLLDREREAQIDLTRTRDECARLESTVGPLRGRLGAHDPEGWTTRSPADRELQAPWLDPDWNEARTALFLAALRLHESWIAHAGERLRHNLHAAIDAVAGQTPKKGHEEALRAAWQTLFLVVPTVSTTFASVSRMFAGVGPEALGWLFVDEAGQATPQSVVGALWRSRRAVVVGDPLQVEPVVSVPFVAQQQLRSYFGVDDRWLPARSSVQTLADELAPYGTWLPTQEGQDRRRWVGAPLLVHRRCIEPMFGICNDIAYGGMMIQATREPHGLELPNSFWMDVAGPAEDHWRPDQGIAAFELLRSLVLDYGVPAHDIFVISPFREVREQLFLSLRADPRLRDARVGTVHTAQGREADVVVLVLGGDAGKPRAKSFACEKPNVLNVAVSRARRRLYVIGQRSDWGREPYFDRLAVLPEPDHNALTAIVLPGAGVSATMAGRAPIIGPGASLFDDPEWGR